MAASTMTGMPWDNKLAVLIHNPSFQDFVDEPDLVKRMDFIRKAGNNAAHRPAAITLPVNTS